MPDAFDFSNPPQRQRDRGAQKPLLTYLLVGLSVLITAAYLTPDTTPGSLWYQIGHFGVLPVTKIWDGAYYGLVTCIFTHLDLVHILFNMYWLIKMGTLLELTLPPLTYAGFIAIAAALGSGAEIAVSSQTGAGMSGVGYALFGLLWAGRGRFPEWRTLATRQNLQLFIVWGLFCVVTTYAHIFSVANAAHAGGFVFGLAIGYLFYAPRRKPLWAIPLVGLVLLTLMAVTWVPWSWEWNFWKGNQEFKRRDYPAAIALYRRSLALESDDPSAWYNISLAWQNIAYHKLQQNNLPAARDAQQQAALAMEKAGPTRQEETPDGNQPPGSSPSKTSAPDASPSKEKARGSTDALGAGR